MFLGHLVANRSGRLHHPLQIQVPIPGWSPGSPGSLILMRSSSGDGTDSEYSDPTSESSSESSDSSEEGRAYIDLTYERLVSLQPKPRKISNVYAKSGSSAHRIKKALKHPVCSCACKLPFKVLLRLCMGFWCLFKREQDSLLWAIQHESGHQKRKQWFLQGLLAGIFCLLKTVGCRYRLSQEQLFLLVVLGQKNPIYVMRVKICQDIYVNPKNVKNNYFCRSIYVMRVVMLVVMKLTVPVMLSSMMMVTMRMGMMPPTITLC